MSVLFRLKLLKCMMCKNATIENRGICNVETRVSCGCGEGARSDNFCRCLCLTSALAPSERVSACLAQHKFPRVCTTGSGECLVDNKDPQLSSATPIMVVAFIVTCYVSVHWTRRHDIQVCMQVVKLI